MDELLVGTLVFLFLSAIADVVSVYSAIRGTTKFRPLVLHVALLALTIGITIVATYLFHQNQSLIEAEKEAETLLESWPNHDETFLNDGSTNMRIIYGGLAFLQKHKQDLPTAL